MNADAVLAATLSMVAAAALIVAVRAVHRPPVQAATTPAPALLLRRAVSAVTLRFGRRDAAAAAIGLGLGLLAALIGGWAVAVVILPALAVALPRSLTRHDSMGIEQLEALAGWTRRVASLIASNKTLTEALRESVRSTPPEIQPQVGRLVARLNAHQPTVAALYAFGEELDPRAGPVIGALVLAAGQGHGGLSRILTSMAELFTSEVLQLRKIDNERAAGRSTVRTVTIICVVLLGGLTLSDYGRGYHTPVGQIALLGVAAAFLGLLWVIGIRSKTPPAPQLIVRPSTSQQAATTPPAAAAASPHHQRTGR